MKRLRLVMPALAILVFLLPACGGKKRPPAVTTGGPPPLGSNEGANRPPETLPSGPDLRPMENEGTLGENLNSDSEEGGPLADIHFEYDQAGLTDQSRSTLEKHALWLQGHRDTKVTLEGHCDERGTTEYNLALGDKRAQAAKEYLVSLGIAADRLSSVSFGKEKPLDPGHDEAAWAKNRRVHFRVAR
jgi:peptidoglycan-associated lipoprotein